MITKYPILNEGTKLAVEQYAPGVVRQVQQAATGTPIGSNLCDAPEARGKGIARRLICAVMDQTAAQKLEFDCLADNATAIGVYMGLGCRITGYGWGFGGIKESPAIVFMSLSSTDLACHLSK